MKVLTNFSDIYKLSWNITTLPCLIKSDNTTNILTFYFSKYNYIFFHQTKYHTIFYSVKIPRRLILTKAYFMFFALREKKKTYKPLKVAAANNFFSSVYLLVQITFINFLYDVLLWGLFTTPMSRVKWSDMGHSVFDKK